MSCLNNHSQEEFVKSILKYMHDRNSLATELKKIESYMKQGLSAEEISRKTGRNIYAIKKMYKHFDKGEPLVKNIGNSFTEEAKVENNNISREKEEKTMKKFRVIVKQTEKSYLNFVDATTIRTNNEKYLFRRFAVIANKFGVSINDLKVFDMVTGEEYSVKDFCA